MPILVVAYVTTGAFDSLDSRLPLEMANDVYSGYV